MNSSSENFVKNIYIYKGKYQYMSGVLERTSYSNGTNIFTLNIWRNHPSGKHLIYGQLHNQYGQRLPLYVPCIMFQCVDKPTRCNTSYEWSLLSINWLYMFRTITSPSSGASSHKLYNAFGMFVQASLAVAWMSTQQLDSPDSTNIPTRYTVYEMMLLMMDWW